MKAKVLLLLAWLGALAAGAGAQTTTATLAGRVTDENGQAVAGAHISATGNESGFKRSVVARDDGSFTLQGLTPGDYQVVIVSPAYQAKTQALTVLVGQSLDLVFKLTPSTVITEGITVVGTELVETKTSEVATNVTREELRHLPQNNRNFLNFAALAPGVRVSDNEFRKEISSGALEARDTNVFIDGVSQKNDVLEGGVVGQDASRGNPFPQNAVQEFRVVTQNYGAQYQKATSAIITAVTRSGGNQIAGDLFVYYQDKDLVAEDDFAAADAKKPEYERLQTGFSLGGPIKTDRLHYFLSYEGNDQDRANRVSLGNPAFRELFGGLEGSFQSPFRSDLGFAKLSYQTARGDLLDWSANYRHETDIRGFGGTTSFESAENVKNDVAGTTLRHQRVGDRWINEASLSYNWYQWNPQPQNPDQIGQEFQGVIRIGGRDSEQDFTQTRVSLRDDYTLSGVTWHGDHTMKVGGNVDFLEYDVSKELFGNPLFVYNSSLTVPFEARYGVGNPDLSSDNKELGVYFQDDWAVTSRLTIALGLRYDYETDMFDSDYETPQNVRQAFAGKLPSQYFTDGNDREVFDSAWQPRVGFSYDVSDAGTTVVFGGWGRFYDRVLYNYGLDEKYRLNYGVRTFRFSADGLPRDGQPTILWRPEYLSKAGLDGLIASGVAPNPEVFLIENDTKPPVADQWSLGVRQNFGPWAIDLTYVNIRSENGFSFIFGNRNAEGNCCVQLAPGFSNVLLSTDDKQSWYDGVYLTVDRPFHTGGRFPWGMRLAYTYGEAEQNGGDLFSLDFPTIADYPRYPTNNDERHRVVYTAMVGLPWGLRASTLITLGSGVPYHIFDASLGFGPNEFRFRRNEGRPEKYDFIFPDAWAYRTVDLRVEKSFGIGGDHELGVVLEAFNVFDFENYGCYQGFKPPAPEVNAKFGQPDCLVEPGRRLQAGVTFAF
jgi:hypothetical protein